MLARFRTKKTRSRASGDRFQRKQSRRQPKRIRLHRKSISLATTAHQMLAARHHNSVAAGDSRNDECLHTFDLADDLPLRWRDVSRQLRPRRADIPGGSAAARFSGRGPQSHSAFSCEGESRSLERSSFAAENLKDAERCCPRRPD